MVKCTARGLDVGVCVLSVCYFSMSYVVECDGFLEVVIKASART